MRFLSRIGSIVAFCIVVVAPPARSDDAGWIRLLDGWRYATIDCVRQTRDGGTLVAGSNGVMWRGDLDDAVIARLDPSGNFIWKKIVGGSGRESFVAVVETDDGSFVAAGVTSSFGYPNGTWLVKFSASGEIVWNRSLDLWGPPTTLLNAADGGFVLAAGSHFVRLDASGNALSVKTYKDQFLRLNSLAKTADGGYLAAGYRACAKLDGGGNVEWIRDFDHPLYDGIEAEDGGFLVIGYEDFGTCFKLDARGKLVWKKQYRTPLLSDFAKVAPTGRGTYLLVGQIWLDPYWRSRPWFVEIDPSGTLLSHLTLESGDRTGSFAGIGESSDGSLLLSGTVTTFGSGVGRDGLLMKISPSGDLGACSALFIDTTAVVSSARTKLNRGDPTSLTTTIRSRPVKSIIADWEAVCRSPCQ